MLPNEEQKDERWEKAGKPSDESNYIFNCNSQRREEQGSRMFASLSGAYSFSIAAGPTAGRKSPPRPKDRGESPQWAVQFRKVSHSHGVELCLCGTWVHEGFGAPFYEPCLCGVEVSKLHSSFFSH